MAKEKINLFDVIPFVSEHIETIKEGGLSVVTFPRFPNRFMQRMLARYAKSEHIHIRLDEKGSAVWEMIDGKRSVREICNLLRDDFKEEEDFESRVVSFIAQLQAKGFIRYKVAV